MPRRPPTRGRRARVAPLAATALLGLVLGAAAAPSTASAATPGDPVAGAGSAAGTFYPVPVTALLGSRAAPATLAAGSVVPVGVTGRPGLPPAGVSAVVVNVTLEAVGGRPVLLSLRPRLGALATARPLTSATALAGRTTTTLVTVPLDQRGGFDVLASGPARVRVDLVGLYAADDTVVAALGPSGGYQPMSAVRVVGVGAGASAPDDDATGDSSGGSPSDPSGTSGDGAGGTPSPEPTVDPALAAALAPGEQRRVALDLGGADAHVTALLVRATVVAAPAAGTVTVAPDPAATGSTPAAGQPDQTTPATPTTPAGQSDQGDQTGGTAAVATPTVSVPAGGTASNLAVVPAALDGDGLLRVVLSGTLPAPADVRLDVVGFYDDGDLGPDLRFRSLPVGRVVDTRSGTGTAGPLTRSSSVTPDGSVAGVDTFALVGTLTTLGAADPARPGAVTALVRVGPGDDPVAAGPGALPVPVGSQQTTPVQPEVGTDGSLALAAVGPARATPVQAVLDVVGSLEAYPEVTDPSARGWVDAVPGWQVRALAR